MAKVAAEVGSTTNSYQILAKLAAGGMAEIYLARGAGVAGVKRYCVLKRIRRERAGDAQFVQMFLDEARLAAQLQHPNIASVYDVGMLGTSYFFTMEYVHGETVRSLVHRAQAEHRPLPLPCVLTIIAGAAAGLHHAHERTGTDGRPLGIVHRDVSPSNLMVSYEGNVKVVDFGVAKAADRATETRSGTVKGKISYLSPEQCRSLQVDRRSDLFALGVVMWEMLTGARLYRRASDFESMTAIASEPPRAPSSLRPEVPRAIDDIVLRLLAKPASHRFQSAAAVVEAIEHASLRAGTILSTSAVSRLVRELFGVRAEPWLEIEGEESPNRPVTLTSRPVPEHLVHTAADPVDAELAAVRDLSRSNLILDSADDHVALPAPAAEGAAARPGGHDAAVPADAPTGSMAPSVIDEALPEGADRATPRPKPTPDRRRPAASSRRHWFASRVPRALIVLCVLASAGGAAATWLATWWTRQPAVVAPSAPSADGDRHMAAALPRPSPAIELIDLGSPRAGERIAREAAASAPPGGHDEPAAAAPARPTEADPPARRPARATRSTGRDAASPAPAHAAAPSPAPNAPHHPPAAADPAPAAPSTEDARATAPPPIERPSATSLALLLQNDEVITVVRLCSEATVTEDIAAPCVLAACRARAFDKAESWLPVVAGDKQRELAARCEKLRRAAEPRAGSGEDNASDTADACLTNPRDCR